MPPKKAPATDGDGSGGSSFNGLRENELRFVKAVFDNMTQKPDADWSKVAVDLGLKDAKCAKERFRQMSVRHGWRSQGQSSSPNASPSKGKKGPTGPSGDGKVTKRARVSKKWAAKKEETPDAEDVKKDEDEDQDQDNGVKEEETSATASDCS